MRLSRGGPLRQEGSGDRGHLRRRDRPGHDRDSVLVVDRAASVESTAGVYFVPAFTGLGAPHWDGRVRGTIVGLTRGTRREHVVRAALESTAFQTRDVLEAMAADAGIDIVRPEVDETTALGAAYAAGLAVEYWATVDDLRANWRVDATFEPDPDAAPTEREYGRWQDAVDRSGRWADEE